MLRQYITFILLKNSAFLAQKLKIFIFKLEVYRKIDKVKYCNISFPETVLILIQV